MSDFWARKLNGAAPQAPARQPSAPVVPVHPNQMVQSPWWAPQPVQPVAPPQAYNPYDQQNPYAQQNNQQLGPDHDQTFQEALQQGYQPTQQTVLKAKSLRQMGTCPECGSGNYMKTGTVGGHPVMHCYDCGFPIVQSASGDTMPSTNKGGGAVQPARQLPTPGFQPHVIVDRV